jgi:hypothetical protein
MASGGAASVKTWIEQARARLAVDWRTAWPDVALGAALALAGAVVTAVFYARLTPEIHHLSTWDFWFESDPYRVFDLAVDRLSYHHHSTSHHPLFSLIVFPPVFVLTVVFGLGPEAAMGVTLAGCAAVFMPTAYATQRMMALPRLDAAVFTALMGASAAFLFWFPVPETFSFGALSILIVIAVSAFAERNDGAPPWLFLFASVAAFSVTTTNWLAGAGMLVVFMSFRIAVWRGVQTLFLALAFWALEAAAFPETDNFLNIFRGSEVDYLFNPESIGVIPKLIVFVFHSIVMPDITTAYGYRLTVQGEWPGAGGALAALGALLWAALIGLGGWSAVRLLRERGLAGAKAIVVLLLALAGQLLITILFGIESFLYSPHFAPLLVLVAALAALTPMRRVALGLAAALTLVAGVNNVQKLESAAALVAERYEHERRFTVALAAETDATQLYVCGASALAGSGEIGMHREPPAEAEIRGLDSTTDPDTCAYTFEEAFVPREGWRMYYEDWSLETIETYAARGARYFVTQNEYGLAERPDFFDALDARYRSLARNAEWAIYDLQSGPEGE